LTPKDPKHHEDSGAAPAAVERFSPRLMYGAARLYYTDNATQAEVAERLGTSRATVSRLLAEARRRGIVRIEVIPPARVDEDLAEQVRDALGLEEVFLAEDGAAAGGMPLAPPLADALGAADLQAGDVLLVSSGRTVYDAAQLDLPRQPGLVVLPTLGGQDEPEAWFQTNEITRLFAAKIGGRPVFLYAPALPSADLHRTLVDEPSIRRVLELWESARCAVLGIGAPLLTRRSIPAHLPSDASALHAAAGDISSRFYNRSGEPVGFPGDDRLLGVTLRALARIPYSIGIAQGEEKVGAITIAARAGYVNRLVTDTPTARALLRHAGRSDAVRTDFHRRD
jgi:DNA-binding transcriptional regulator LsrR (DeoR family)